MNRSKFQRGQKIVFNLKSNSHVSLSVKGWQDTDEEEDNSNSSPKSDDPTLSNVKVDNQVSTLLVDKHAETAPQPPDIAKDTISLPSESSPHHCQENSTAYAKADLELSQIALPTEINDVYDESKCINSQISKHAQRETHDSDERVFENETSRSRDENVRGRGRKSISRDERSRSKDERSRSPVKNSRSQDGNVRGRGRKSISIDERSRSPVKNSKSQDGNVRGRGRKSISRDERSRSKDERSRSPVKNRRSRDENVRGRGRKNIGTDESSSSRYIKSRSRDERSRSRDERSSSTVKNSRSRDEYVRGRGRKNLSRDERSRSRDVMSRNRCRMSRSRDEDRGSCDEKSKSRGRKTRSRDRNVESRRRDDSSNNITCDNSKKEALRKSYHETRQKDDVKKTSFSKRNNDGSAMSKSCFNRVNAVISKSSSKNLETTSAKVSKCFTNSSSSLRNGIMVYDECDDYISDINDDEEIHANAKDDDQEDCGDDHSTPHQDCNAQYAPVYPCQSRPSTTGHVHPDDDCSLSLNKKRELAMQLLKAFKSQDTGNCRPWRKSETTEDSDELCESRKAALELVRNFKKNKVLNDDSECQGKSPCNSKRDQSEPEEKNNDLPLEEVINPKDNYKQMKSVSNNNDDISESIVTTNKLLMEFKLRKQQQLEEQMNLQQKQQDSSDSSDSDSSSVLNDESSTCSSVSIQLSPPSKDLDDFQLIKDDTDCTDTDMDTHNNSNVIPTRDICQSSSDETLDSNDDGTDSETRDNVENIIKKENKDNELNTLKLSNNVNIIESYVFTDDDNSKEKRNEDITKLFVGKDSSQRQMHNVQVEIDNKSEDNQCKNAMSGGGDTRSNVELIKTKEDNKKLVLDMLRTFKMNQSINSSDVDSFSVHGEPCRSISSEDSSSSSSSESDDDSIHITDNVCISNVEKNYCCKGVSEKISPATCANSPCIDTFLEDYVTNVQDTKPQCEIEAIECKTPTDERCRLTTGLVDVMDSDTETMVVLSPRQRRMKERKNKCKLWSEKVSARKRGESCSPTKLCQLNKGLAVDADMVAYSSGNIGKTNENTGGQGEEKNAPIIVDDSINPIDDNADAASSCCSPNLSNTPIVIDTDSSSESEFCESSQYTTLDTFSPTAISSPSQSSPAIAFDLSQIPIPPAPAVMLSSIPLPGNESLPPLPDGVAPSQPPLPEDLNHADIPLPANNYVAPERIPDKSDDKLSSNEETMINDNTCTDKQPDDPLSMLQTTPVQDLISKYLNSLPSKLTDSKTNLLKTPKIVFKIGPKYKQQASAAIDQQKKPTQIAKSLSELSSAKSEDGDETPPPPPPPPQQKRPLNIFSCSSSSSCASISSRSSLAGDSSESGDSSISGDSDSHQNSSSSCVSASSSTVASSYTCSSSSSVSGDSITFNDFDSSLSIDLYTESPKIDVSTNADNQKMNETEMVPSYEDLVEKEIPITSVIKLSEKIITPPPTLNVPECKTIDNILDIELPKGEPPMQILQPVAPIQPVSSVQFLPPLPPIPQVPTIQSFPPLPPIQTPVQSLPPLPPPTAIQPVPPVQPIPIPPVQPLLTTMINIEKLSTNIHQDNTINQTLSKDELEKYDPMDPTDKEEMYDPLHPTEDQCESIEPNTSESPVKSSSTFKPLKLSKITKIDSLASAFSEQNDDANIVKQAKKLVKLPETVEEKEKTIVEKPIESVPLSDKLIRDIASKIENRISLDKAKNPLVEGKLKLSSTIRDHGDSRAISQSKRRTSPETSKSFSRRRSLSRSHSRERTDRRGRDRSPRIRGDRSSTERSRRRNDSYRKRSRERTPNRRREDSQRESSPCRDDSYRRRQHERTPKKGDRSNEPSTRRRSVERSTRSPRRSDGYSRDNLARKRDRSNSHDNSLRRNIMSSDRQSKRNDRASRERYSTERQTKVKDSRDRSPHKMRSSPERPIHNRDRVSKEKLIYNETVSPDKLSRRKDRSSIEKYSKNNTREDRNSREKSPYKNRSILNSLSKKKDRSPRRNDYSSRENSPRKRASQFPKEEPHSPNISQPPLTSNDQRRLSNSTSPQKPCKLNEQFDRHFGDDVGQGPPITEMSLTRLTSQEQEAADIQRLADEHRLLIQLEQHRHLKSLQQQQQQQLALNQQEQLVLQQAQQQMVLQQEQQQQIVLQQEQQQLAVQQQLALQQQQQQLLVKQEAPLENLDSQQKQQYHLLSLISMYPHLANLPREALEAMLAQQLQTSDSMPSENQTAEMASAESNAAPGENALSQAKPAVPRTRIKPRDPRLQARPLAVSACVSMETSKVVPEEITMAVERAGEVASSKRKSSMLVENNDTPASSICGFDVGVDRRVSFSTVSAGSDIEEALTSLAFNDLSSKKTRPRKAKDKKKNRRKKHSKKHKSEHRVANEVSLNGEKSSKRHIVNVYGDNDAATSNNLSSEEPESKRSRQQDANDCEEIGDSADNNEIDATKRLDENGIPYFERLLKSEYTSDDKVRIRQHKEARHMVCDCEYDKDKISCGEICMNRSLQIECGSRCKCGDHCTNKNFQNRTYCNIEVEKSGDKGYGLMSRQKIKKGTFVIEYVGEILEMDEFQARTMRYSSSEHFYFMALNGKEIIDASRKGNVSRFINHSCKPNCETQKWSVCGLLRVGFFAVNDIEKDEELTFDYKFEQYGETAQKCFCGTSECRGIIGTVKKNTKDKKQRRRKNDENADDANSSGQEENKDFANDSLNEEIDEVIAFGRLHNEPEVLALCRVMMKTEASVDRIALLDVILGCTNTKCLQLFLDCHGLSLLSYWSSKDMSNEIKFKILQVLKLLPIPTKNILTRSRINDIVKKWHEESSPTSSDIPGDDREICESASPSFTSDDKAVSAEVTASTEPEDERSVVEDHVQCDTGVENTKKTLADPIDQVSSPADDAVAAIQESQSTPQDNHASEPLCETSTNRGQDVEIPSPTDNLVDAAASLPARDGVVQVKEFEELTQVKECEDEKLVKECEEEKLVKESEEEKLVKESEEYLQIKECEGTTKLDSAEVVLPQQGKDATQITWHQEACDAEEVNLKSESGKGGPESITDDQEPQPSSSTVSTNCANEQSTISATTTSAAARKKKPKKAVVQCTTRVSRRLAAKLDPLICEPRIEDGAAKPSFEEVIRLRVQEAIRSVENENDKQECQSNASEGVPSDSDSDSDEDNIPLDKMKKKLKLANSDQDGETKKPAKDVGKGKEPSIDVEAKESKQVEALTDDDQTAIAVGSSEDEDATCRQFDSAESAIVPDEHRGLDTLEVGEHTDAKNGEVLEGENEEKTDKKCNDDCDKVIQETKEKSEFQIKINSMSSDLLQEWSNLKEIFIIPKKVKESTKRKSTRKLEQSKKSKTTEKTKIPEKLSEKDKIEKMTKRRNSIDFKPSSSIGSGAGTGGDSHSMSTEEVWNRRNFFEKSQEKKDQMQAVKDAQAVCSGQAFYAGGNAGGAPTPASPLIPMDDNAPRIYKRPNDPRIYAAQGSPLSKKRRSSAERDLMWDAAVNGVPAGNEVTVHSVTPNHVTYPHRATYPHPVTTPHQAATPSPQNPTLLSLVSPLAQPIGATLLPGSQSHQHHHHHHQQHQPRAVHAKIAVVAPTPAFKPLPLSMKDDVKAKQKAKQDEKMANLKLPENWKINKDQHDNIYFYNIITRETQWTIPVCPSDTGKAESPAACQGNGEEIGVKRESISNKADIKKKLSMKKKKKYQAIFKSKLSDAVVKYLNPYKEDLSHDVFKNLARKITHGILSKELVKGNYKFTSEIMANTKKCVAEYMKTAAKT